MVLLKVERLENPAAYSIPILVDDIEGLRKTLAFLHMDGWATRVGVLPSPGDGFLGV
jgi:hypothetical protein